MVYLYLGIAIVVEVAGTVTGCIEELVGFHEAMHGRDCSVRDRLFFLALTLRTIPVGIAYAVWGGAGMALSVISGAVLFNDVPDIPAIIVVGLILMGVVIVNTMSATTAYSGM